LVDKNKKKGILPRALALALGKYTSLPRAEPWLSAQTQVYREPNVALGKGNIVNPVRLFAESSS